MCGAYHQGAAVGLSIKDHAQEVSVVLYAVRIGAWGKDEFLAEGPGPCVPLLALPCVRVQASKSLPRIYNCQPACGHGARAAGLLPLCGGVGAGADTGMHAIMLGAS